ncbi:hypothetical protein JL722_12312 [Aureococcus anophagefferens]|nr:hypothetical protein JL722_12312 [Aureococcus anophagefferens]
MRAALLLQLAVVRCLAEHGANDVESIRDELHSTGLRPHKGPKRKVDEDPHCISDGADAPRLGVNESWNFSNASALHGVSRSTRVRMITEALRRAPPTQHGHMLLSCSYPCQADHRTPDVAVLAEAAEAAGVDLSVLVSTRPVLEIVERHGGATNTCIYALACEELLRQLRELDPAFYRCFPYRDTLSMGASEARFLGVNATKLAKVAVTNFEPTTVAGGMEKKEAPRRRRVLLRLARNYDATENEPLAPGGSVVVVGAGVVGVSTADELSVAASAASAGAGDGGRGRASNEAAQRALIARAADVGFRGIRVDGSEKDEASASSAESGTFSASSGGDDEDDDDELSGATSESGESGTGTVSDGSGESGSDSESSDASSESSGNSIVPDLGADEDDEFEPVRGPAPRRESGRMEFDEFRQAVSMMGKVFTKEETDAFYREAMTFESDPKALGNSTERDDRGLLKRNTIQSTRKLLGEHLSQKGFVAFFEKYLTRTVDPKEAAEHFRALVEGAAEMVLRDGEEGGDGGDEDAIVNELRQMKDTARRRPRPPTSTATMLKDDTV